MLPNDPRRCLEEMANELKVKQPDYQDIARCLSWFFDPHNDEVVTKAQAKHANDYLQASQKKFFSEFEALYLKANKAYDNPKLTFVQRVGEMRELRDPRLDPDLPNQFYSEHFGREIYEEHESIWRKLENLNNDEFWDEDKLSLFGAHFDYYEHHRRPPEFFRHNNDLLIKLEQLLPSDPRVREWREQFDQWKDDDNAASAIQTLGQQWNIEVLLDQYDAILRLAERGDSEAESAIQRYKRQLTKKCYEYIERDIREATGWSIEGIPSGGYILNNKYNVKALLSYFSRIDWYFNPAEWRPGLDGPLPTELVRARAKPESGLLPQSDRSKWEKAQEITKKYIKFLEDAKDELLRIEARQMDAREALEYLYQKLMPCYSPSPNSYIHSISIRSAWRVVNDFKEIYAGWTRDAERFRALRKDDVEQQITAIRSNLIMQTPTYPARGHIDELNQLISNMKDLLSLIHQAPRLCEKVTSDCQRLIECLDSDDLSHAKGYFDDLEYRRREGVYYLPVEIRQLLTNATARYWCLARDQEHYNLRRAGREFQSAKRQGDKVQIERIKTWLESKPDLHNEREWQRLYRDVADQLGS